MSARDEPHRSVAVAREPRLKEGGIEAWDSLGYTGVDLPRARDLCDRSFDRVVGQLRRREFDRHQLGIIA